ncbi:MAG: Hpt domain-containing protein [Betaproteobacteria bacterium]|nr:Hpt domain-containing protein [Betaproteobacteria bacterium]
MSGPPDDGKSVPIDRSILAVLTGGDPLVERRMLAVLRRANNADAAALREAVERHDIASITRASHRMMGASRLAGATTLADICAAIARAGPAGDWDAIAANRAALDRELDRVNGYLDMQLRDPQ